MPQLTIDALIAQLQGFRARFGDLPIVLRDADTEWAFRLNASQLGVDHDTSGFGTRLQFMAKYGDDMEVAAQLSAPTRGRQPISMPDTASMEDLAVS